MKHLFLTLITGLFISTSCSNSSENTSEEIQETLKKRQKEFVTSNSEKAIESLKYIILRNNRYYLDEQRIQKDKVDDLIIKQLREDIYNVNKALQEREEYLKKNKNNIQSYELNLMDFQKQDIDSLKQEYKNSHSYNYNRNNITGDISTTSQSERTTTIHNPRYNKVSFTARGRTAIFSFHTFGASSTFGGWQYKDGSASFASNVTREISLYSNNDNLRLSYRTSDPEGGDCGYILK